MKYYTIEEIFEKANDFELIPTFEMQNNFKGWEMIFHYKHPKDWSPPFQKECYLETELQVKQILSVTFNPHSFDIEDFLSVDGADLDGVEVFDGLTFEDGFVADLVKIDIIEHCGNGSTKAYNYKNSKGEIKLS